MRQTAQTKAQKNKFAKNVQWETGFAGECVQSGPKSSFTQNILDDDGPLEQ
jgi:hypothetical protein